MKKSTSKQEESPALPTWDYIAEFVVDTRASDKKMQKEFYDGGVYFIRRTIIPIRGGIDAECYFDECLENASASDILPSEITGRLALEDPPGIYRLVFGVNSKGDKIWTDCGYEYDAWEEYDLISKHAYTAHEAEHYFDRQDQEDMLQLLHEKQIDGVTKAKAKKVKPATIEQYEIAVDNLLMEADQVVGLSVTLDDQILHIKGLHTGEWAFDLSMKGMIT